MALCTICYRAQAYVVCVLASSELVQFKVYSSISDRSLWVTLTDLFGVLLYIMFVFVGAGLSVF